MVPLERSRKVIRLERRGREPGGRTPSSAVFGILGLVFILYCAGIGIAGFGTYFFLLWGVMGAGCLVLSIALNSRRLMEALPGWIKTCCCIVFIAGLALFGGVEGMILSQYNAKAAPGADYMIVLGAQWKSTGPSEALRRRLDTAADYLQRNPGTKVVVSGGQGGNENISEAAGMKEYLMGKGIGEERILTEDRSSNTFENIVFSGEYLDRGNDRVVIVTNNFHIFRAVGIARKQGYAHVEGLAADSVLGMAPNNLLREFFGVMKDFAVGNL